MVDNDQCRKECVVDNDQCRKECVGGGRETCALLASSKVTKPKPRFLPGFSLSDGTKASDIRPYLPIKMNGKNLGARGVKCTRKFGVGGKGNAEWAHLEKTCSRVSLRVSKLRLPT
jgi:hypothetical protein